MCENYLAYYLHKNNFYTYNTRNNSHTNTIKKLLWKQQWDGGNREKCIYLKKNTLLAMKDLLKPPILFKASPLFIPLRARTHALAEARDCALTADRHGNIPIQSLLFQSVLLTPQSSDFLNFIFSLIRLYMIMYSFHLLKRISSLPFFLYCNFRCKEYD